MTAFMKYIHLLFRCSPVSILNPGVSFSGAAVKVFKPAILPKLFYVHVKCFCFLRRSLLSTGLLSFV